jgi:hypothetical protein
VVGVIEASKHNNTVWGCRKAISGDQAATGMSGSAGPVNPTLARTRSWGIWMPIRLGNRDDHALCCNVALFGLYTAYGAIAHIYVECRAGAMMDAPSRSAAAANAAVVLVDRRDRRWL